MGKLESTIKPEIQRLAKAEVPGTLVPLLKQVRAKRTRIRGAVLAILLVVLVLPGSLWAQKEEPPTSQDKKPQASYYDFDDILVPSGLTLDKKNSVVYGAGRQKVGVLIFKGRVDPLSLADFFQNNMQKDGWKLFGVFRHREYLFGFLKEDRVCVITISKRCFSTKVTVNVGPIERTYGPKTGSPK